MSHSHPAGSLSAYNSLTDKHLAGYFSNTRIRRHLLRSGLITGSGRILSEKEYKVNIMKQDHQKHIRECLAQAIFRKVLDMERYHQLEIRRKLEGLAKKERIQRFKGEHTRRLMEDNMPTLTPHPPASPKTNHGHSVLADQGHSSPLTPTAPRPYTAPGSMQPPIRLQPLLPNRTRRNVSKITSGSKPKTSLLESETPFPIGGKKAMMKFRSSLDGPQRVDPYQLPHINSYLIPVPPPTPPPAGKITQESRYEAWRRKRFRPTTAPHGLEPLFIRDSGRVYKTSPHSNAVIKMVYFGKNVHLSYEDTDFRDEIKIYQQHCGGENLCVYKGKLHEKDNFQFISKRHHGFPFSLTFFLNGIQVNRLSSCCEFKHRRSSRLGGKRGYFGFVCVEKASPCYKCIIAMGLDKRTSSTKSRKEKNTDKKEESKKGQGKLKRDRENVPSRRNETDGKETPVSANFSAEEIKSGVGEVRTAVEEMEWKEKPGDSVWEEDQGSTFKYDYEEDFEVDEEKREERADEEQADDPMSRMSNSPPGDNKDAADPSSEKAPDADKSEIQERDGCWDSEEDEDKQDIKTASSSSSRSHSYSSESEDDSAEGSRDALSGHSTDRSSRSSSSQELHESDDPGNSQVPAEHALETETEEQEITAVDVEDRPPLTEGSRERGAEEESEEKGGQEAAESQARRSRKPASEEAQDKVEDRKAGPPGVEDSVGLKASDAEAPSCQHSDTVIAVSNAEDGVTAKRKPEAANLGGARNGNLGVEQRAELITNARPKLVAREMGTLEKKAGTEEDEAPQPLDADTAGEKATLWEKAAAVDGPTGERSPTVGQPEQKGEIPLSIASGAEADAEGSNSPEKEKLDSTGQALVRDSGCLSGDEAPGSQGSEDPNRQTVVCAVPWIQEEVSDREQGLGEAVLTDSTALPSESLREAAVRREEAVTQEEGEAEGEAEEEAERKAEGEAEEKGEAEEEAEAEGEAGSRELDVHPGKDGAPAEPEDVRPAEDTASQRRAGPEESAVPRTGGDPPEDRQDLGEEEDTGMEVRSEEETKAPQRGTPAEARGTAGAGLAGDSPAERTVASSGAASTHGLSGVSTAAGLLGRAGAPGRGPGGEDGAPGRGPGGEDGAPGAPAERAPAERAPGLAEPDGLAGLGGGEAGDEGPPGTAPGSRVGVDGASGGGASGAGEDLHRAAAEPGASKAPSADVGGCTRHTEGRAPGPTAAEATELGAQAPSAEAEVMRTAAGSGTETPEPNGSEAAQPGQDGQGREVEAARCTGSAGEEPDAGPRDGDGGYLSGAAAGGSTPRAYLETAPSSKLDFSGTPERHPHRLQRESESPSSTKEEAVPPQTDVFEVSSGRCGVEKD